MIRFALADFAAAAKIVRNVPSTSSGIAILDHAKMTAVTGKMTLTMSSLDIEATVTFPCETAEPAEAALPRAVLDFFIAHAGTGSPDGSLEFDGTMTNVTARHDKARLTMPILLASDFPQFGGKPEWSWTVRANELTGLLRTCEKAMDTTRPMIMGVYLHRTSEDLRAVATDGHRVHVAAMDLPDMDGSPDAITIPEKSVRELIRIFADDESEITVSGSRSMLTVSGARISVNSKLVAEPFIDYQRLIAEPGANRMAVDAAALESAITRLTILPRNDGKGKIEASRPIRMSLADGMMRLEIRGNIGADAEDFVPCEAAGEGGTFSMQARYIRDAIAAAGEKRVIFAEAAGGNAVRMLTDDDRNQFMIMQIRF